MEKELLLFDLDGTLIDSSEDIAWVANQTLSDMDYAERDHEEIKSYIGWGISMLLMRLMPDLSDDELETARGRFLDYYATHFTVDTAPYDGVMETLDHFKAMGKEMGVVTNKPVSLSKAILSELYMAGYFKLVLGGDSLEERKPHPAQLLYAMDELCFTPEETVYVGDCSVDYEAGKRAEVTTIGATYGFRGKEELVKAGAIILIDSFSELTGIID
ncbi:MAG: HAD-IA family hydrolase [Thermodesulfobacteriota bacterium]